MLRPISRLDWTPTRAAHLLNRAGFGGDPNTVETFSRLSVDEAIDRLVNFDQIPDPVDPPEFAAMGPPSPPERAAMRNATEEERRRMQREQRVTNRVQMNQTRGWWFDRMVNSPRPLQEKLTLFWHGHFATSFEKVRSAYAMYQQNETFRRHAAGSWEEMILAVSKDPAMLIYLDGARNRKQAPNENYARELMELFTLGEGHYAELDIMEAARAFTGWGINRQTFSFQERPRQHDNGNKRFMGESGALDGADIVEIILKQDQAAVFLCRKLWEFFAYADPEESLVNDLAAVFRGNDYQLRPLLTALFRSRAFYSTKAGRTQIKSPVQWLISSLKYLEAPLPDPGMCAFMTSRLGQTLFQPPNVKGWDGGTSWITTATLLERYNLAAVLVEGGEGAQPMVNVATRGGGGGMMMMDMPPSGENEETIRRRRRAAMQERRQRLATPVMDTDRVLPTQYRASKEVARRHLQWRLFQSQLRDKDLQTFRDFFESLPEPREWTETEIRSVIHALMSTPQFQLT